MNFFKSKAKIQHGCNDKKQSANQKLKVSKNAVATEEA